MSDSGRVRTISLPFRKICSTLPAVVLISGGIILSASTAQGHGNGVAPASSSSSAIVVPDVAISPPGAGKTLAQSLGVQPPNVLAPPPVPPARPLASLLPPGTVPGSSTPVTLDSSGIPVRALEGYRRAATLTAAADPSCHIDWALLAAIGRVESNHARFGGNQLDASGTAQPGIIGIPLDGRGGTALITDTDKGRWDRDTTYDRAVGPMQFIPGTWRADGVDANGDGVKDPQNMADAATAAAVYLCSGPGDLRNPTDLRSAILRYNASDSYVKMVTSIANAYRHGVVALPASALTPVKAAAPTSPNSGPPATPLNALASTVGPTPAIVQLPVSGQRTPATNPARPVLPLTPLANPAVLTPGPTQLTPIPNPGTPLPTTRTPGTVPPTTTTPAGTGPPTSTTPAGTGPPTSTTPAGTVPPTTTTPAGTVPPTTTTPAGTVPPTTTTPTGTVPPTTTTPAGTVPPTTLLPCPPIPTPTIGIPPTPTPTPTITLPPPTTAQCLPATGVSSTAPPATAAAASTVAPAAAAGTSVPASTLPNPTVTGVPALP